MWYSILFWSCFITIFSERELLCLWGHTIVKMFNKHFLLMLGTLCVYIGIFTLFYFEQMPFVKFLIFFPAMSYLSISLILMSISIYICSVCVCVPTLHTCVFLSAMSLHMNTTFHQLFFHFLNYTCLEEKYYFLFSCI